MNADYPKSFTEAVSRVLEDEGGFADLRRDPGGETKYGISKREYPGLDIAALTRAEATAIYYRDWWLKFGYARLPEPIAAKVFDLAVNLGPRAAHTCLQHALRACHNPVPADGELGPTTCVAAAGVDAQTLLAALRSEAAGRYRELAALRPCDKAFIDGWLNRAYE